MKKTSLITSFFLMTLTLLLTLDVSAQQNAKAQEPKNGVSLERALAQIEQGLKESTVTELNQWTGSKRTYVRLKRRGGCDISFQVSETPSFTSGTSRQRLDLSLGEWKVNLRNLNSEVKIDIPKYGDHRLILFSTIGGKESIKYTGQGVGDGGWNSRGWLKISEKNATEVAAALQQAIIACRK